MAFCGDGVTNTAARSLFQMSVMQGYSNHSIQGWWLCLGLVKGMERHGRGRLGSKVHCPEGVRAGYLQCGAAYIFYSAPTILHILMSI